MNIKNIILMLISILIFIGVCSGIYYMAFYENQIYYTKIDNSKVKKVDKSDMPYEYKLISYTEEGKEKEITFKTSRELKEGAYIKIKYMITRGVVSWEEVTYESLSTKLKEIYK